MKNKQCLVLWGEISARKSFEKEDLCRIFIIELRCYLRKQIVHNIDSKSHSINIFLENMSEIDIKTPLIYKNLLITSQMEHNQKL